MRTRIDSHISFIGKCVLIEDDFPIEGEREKKKYREEKGQMGKLKILVLGDVHLGYGGAGSGFLPKMIFKETLEELEKVLKEVGKVDLVILLGDVKHYFGEILDEEWRETRGFFELLKKGVNKDGRIIVVKGNHDMILEPIAREFGFSLMDFYVLGKYGFLHGHKMHQELFDKKIKVLMCGHLHPAVTLREGVKSERYKCFLVGSWKEKKVIVLPSFFPLVEGGDIFYHEGNLVFPLDVKKGDVFIVGQNLDVFPFGKMRKLV